jgi:integrase
MYQLTVTLLHTGARFSEVASLTWNDINFEDETVFFKATKDGNERHISMSKLLKEVLSNLSKNYTLVFPSYKGTQITQMPDKWQTIVDTLMPTNRITVKRTLDGEMLELSQADRELLNIQTKDRLTVHSLRHTHASWMAISGEFNLMEIRDELGHKTTKMTERYAHLMPKDRHRKTNALFDKIKSDKC